MPQTTNGSQAGLLDALQRMHPRSLAHLARELQGLVERRLWAKVLLAMLLGLGIGFALGPSAGLVPEHISQVAAGWLALPGELFLAAIQMIVVPLVFSSIIRGLAASGSVDQLRRLGIRLSAYFVATTALAVGLGLGVAYLIRPGRFVDATRLLASIPSQGAQPQATETASTSVPEMIRSILPTNPLGAMVESEMLQIVLFAIIVGVALIAMAPRQSRPLLELLGSLQAVCMLIVKWTMRLAPLAVFGLLARVTMTVGMDALVGLGVYIATVLVGLLLLMCGYLVIIAIVGRRSPTAFLRAVREVQLLAFSTSSSAAVMPMSIKTAEEQLGVRPSVSQFIVPLGATINMDGTALYQAVATVFLAQVLGLSLGVAAITLLVVTTVGASIGSPSTPGVGIVVLSSVLHSVGIPPEAVLLVIGVDRILDMGRTAVNVTGDLTACVVMDRWVGGELTAAEERQLEETRDEQRSQSGEDVLVGQSTTEA